MLNLLHIKNMLCEILLLFSLSTSSDKDICMWPCLCRHIVFCSIVTQISRGVRAKFDSVNKGNGQPNGQLEAKQKFSSLYCENDPTESAAKNSSMTLAYIA